MLKAIIVDDEPKGRNILQHLLATHFKAIKVVATAHNADKGMALIETWKPDVVFLDVEMPGKNGFVMLNELGKIDFQVIFVSAHNHYALNAIKLSALDFLLKPIYLDDLKNAVNRLLSRSAPSSHQVPNLLRQLQQPKTDLDKIAISSVSSIEFVDIHDIIYCEAASTYTIVHLHDNSIICARNLKEFEEILSAYYFFRIHHSYLINLRHIKKYIKGEGGTVVMRNLAELEVSRRRKTAFMEQLTSI